MSIQDQRAVIYTDGSARPNPGFYGSGLHGYVYQYPEDKKQPTKVNAWIATDHGYVLQKDLVTSKAKPVVITQYIDSFSACLDQGTNNIGEVNALSIFFEHYPELTASLSHLHVLMDSKYLLQGAEEWVDGWERNGWITSAGAPVKNQEVWKRLQAHLVNFKEKATLSLKWVRGHNDDLGNVKADYLAGIATNHSTASLDTQFSLLSDPLRYNKADVDIHPFISLKRIYFNTDPEFNTPGIYHQTGWAGADFICGKRTSEAAFCVAMLDTPDVVVETVIEGQYRVPTEVNSVVYAKIDRLKSADVYPYLRDHGYFCLFHDKRNLNMNFVDNKPVTIEVRAGELPLRAIDVLNHLEEILTKFKEQYLPTGVLSHELFNYSIHEVTNHFYDQASKKVGKTTVDYAVLKKDFVVGCKKTDITLQDTHREVTQTLTLPLIFTDDIPSRNTFKHLENMHPRVFVITWRESDHVLRYSTVIQTDDALGIWSNYFANQLFLK